MHIFLQHRYSKTLLLTTSSHKESMPPILFHFSDDMQGMNSRFALRKLRGVFYQF